MPLPIPSSPADAFTHNDAVLSASGLPRSVKAISADSQAALDAGMTRTRVLFIDDEVYEEDALIRLLAFEGFDVACVRSGIEALARAQSSGWAAIVLDLGLRDTLGLTVLSEFRRVGVAVPVVVVTGRFLDDGHEQACAALGAAAFLRKPIMDASVLAGALRAVIAAHAATLPAGPPYAGRSRSLAGPRATGRGRARPSDGGDMLSALHERALCGNEASVEHICAEVLPVLRHRLRAAFATAADDWIHDAAVDALMEYRGRPARFDPARRVPLSAYLLLAARRNLINRVDKERRRSAVEDAFASGRAPEPREPTPSGAQASATRLPTISVADVAFTESERMVLHLMRDHERNTEVYARTLGFMPLSTAEQRARIKQIKDRLMHRIRRLAARQVEK